MCGHNAKPSQCSGCEIPEGHYNCSCGHSSYVRCNGTVGIEKPNATFGQHGGGGKDYAYWNQNAARKFGGNWYTTTDAGLCAPGQERSPSCTWRIVQTVKRVSKNCLDASILRTVTAANKTCFSACAQPNNLSSVCTTRCLFATVLGPTGGSAVWNEGSGGLPAQQLLAAREAPFVSSDPARGGCPAV